VKHVRRSFLARFFGATANENHLEHSRDDFSWRKFGRHYLHALVWIIVLTAVVHFMEVSGALKGFEMAGLDTFLRLHGRQMSTRVVLVEITDEDYKDPHLFAGKSPLNNDQLLKLVSSIQTYHPAAIGMDFDTSSEDWCVADISSLAKVLPPSASTHSAPLPPVVWAEIPAKVEEHLKLSPVLGGVMQHQDFVGVPRFPVDSDGLVRRYESEFRVTGSLESCPNQSSVLHAHAPEIPAGPDTRSSNEKHDRDSMVSFARAVLYHACGDPQVNCSSLRPDLRHPVIFNFYGDRYRFPIIQSHEFIGPSADALAAEQNIHRHREDLLKDKIVLIGGNFSAARDVYLTPLGEMAGVELIALAIESDFGGGIRETQKWLEKFADLFVGSLIVLVYFYYRRRPGFALLLSLVAVPVVATAFSLLLFRTAAYWFNFMPIIIGMVLHQMLELSESCGELQEEVRELERQLQARPESVSLVEPRGVEPPRAGASASLNEATPAEEKKLSDEKKPPTNGQ
jgi:CHASE2 domain-containing sensor protein